MVHRSPAALRHDQVQGAVDLVLEDLGAPGPCSRLRAASEASGGDAAQRRPSRSTWATVSPLGDLPACDPPGGRPQVAARQLQESAEARATHAGRLPA